MHKHIPKLDWKLALREIKKKWDVLSEDDILQMQGVCEDHEKKIKKEIKNYNHQAKVYLN